MHAVTMVKTVSACFDKSLKQLLKD